MKIKTLFIQNEATTSQRLDGLLYLFINQFFKSKKLSLVVLLGVKK